MSRFAWGYWGAILLTGVLLAAVGLVLPGQAPAPALWWQFGLLLLPAAAGQMWKVVAPSHQSYHTAMLFFFAGLILLPPGLFVWLIVFPHLAEWVRERAIHSTRLRQWYLQPFNIAMHLVSGAGARMVLLFVSTHLWPSPEGQVVATTLAAVTYGLLNHAITGQMIVAARQVSWKETGILDPGNLATDLIMLLLGQVLAYLGLRSPLLIIPALSPLVLMYRALMVPQLKKDAQTDAKTGLLNAGYWVKSFEAEFDRAGRFGRPLSLIMADLDLLRNINNTYGHLAGDQVLATVGSVIREGVRKYDLAGRFGGEEFVIALPEAEHEQARALAERLRRAIEETPIEIRTSKEPLHVTISLGVATYPQDATSTQDLIHHADVAVYQAKLQGRNRVVSVTDVPHASLLDAPMADDRLHSTVTFTPSARPPLRPSVATPANPPATPAAAPPPAPASSGAAAAAPTPAPPGAHLLPWFVGATIALAGVVALWGSMSAKPPDWVVLLLLAVGAALAEIYQLDIGGGSTVSVGMALNFAAALSLGIPGAVVIGGIIALIHALHRRPALYKVLFNWGTHILAGTAPVLIFRWVGIPHQYQNGLWLLLPGVPAALAYYALESGLITAAVSLSQGLNIWQTWREHYRWLVGHYLVLCLVGLYLSLAYASLGWSGIIIFAVPIVMMRYVLRQYADQTRHSIEELSRMNGELKQANGQIVEASEAIRQQNSELFLTLAKIIDARDPWVAGHSLQVREYAAALGTELGLPAEQMSRLCQAALLHDIGKIGVSEQILHKAARLTEAEFQHVRSHAALGGDFLEMSQGLRHLTPMVRHHHERWDGRGYPSGLQGEQIPLEARLLAICDSVDAMASDRPYRAGKSREEIIVELERCRGSQWDPELVDLAIALLERRGEELLTNSAATLQDPLTGASSALDPRVAWLAELRSAQLGARAVVDQAMP